MTITIKRISMSLILFLLASMYIVFSYYYFTQRDKTASVIVSRINNDLAELSYILSKHIKKEPVAAARPLLDRKAANNKFLSAIAIFDGQQVILTTDHKYGNLPKLESFSLAVDDTDFTVLKKTQLLKKNVPYYQGKHLKNYILVFYLDKEYIMQNFTQARRDFILFFVFIPIFLTTIIWLAIKRLVAQPLETLRQYAYYNSKIPAPFNVTEIEYIRASMVQTFTRLDQERLELYNLARSDSLSGLANRNHLQERVERIIDISKRENKEFALLFLDLDHFKSVNDSLGHDVGDELLRSIAKAIQVTLRTNDVVARIGGDEFVIVLTHYKDSLELYEIIERIQAQLMKPWLINTFPIQITSSIGITVYPKDGDDLLSLMKHADIAMYEAKARGRNGYHFFTEELNTKTQQHIELTNTMREALKNEQYELYYQPQNNVKTGQIIGAEALVRWKNSNGEYTPPDVFIPIAEQSDFIVELGSWILETAMKQLKAWQDKEFDLKLSINVAAKQIQQPEFVVQLKQLLETYEVRAANVFLEITEYVFLNNSEELHKTFSAIKDLGVNISLDDFGTGYSSLSYLKTFPIDLLKIDKSFLDDFGTEEGAIFIATIVNMAQTLKIGVVAEGVETSEQVNYIQSLNCDFYQGYICSKPVEIDAFDELFSLQEQLH